MTTITLEIKFITGEVDLGSTIHAAAAVGYQYNTLCRRTYPHDTPEYRFTEDKTLGDVCQGCRYQMEDLGMPIKGFAANELGDIQSEANLLRAVQHLFEAERHIKGYAKNCPVCGGTQQDGAEGCRLCLPLWPIIIDAAAINGMANSILLVDDPFEAVP